MVQWHFLHKLQHSHKFPWRLSIDSNWRCFQFSSPLLQSIQIWFSGPTIPRNLPAKCCQIGTLPSDDNIVIFSLFFPSLNCEPSAMKTFSLFCMKVNFVSKLDTFLQENHLITLISLFDWPLSSIPTPNWRMPLYKISAYFLNPLYQNATKQWNLSGEVLYSYIIIFKIYWLYKILLIWNATFEADSISFWSKC